MDLSQFDTRVSANEGAWFHFRSPANGEPLFADKEKTRPIRVRLLGKDSDVFKRLSARHANARLKESTRGRNAAPLTQEALENESIAIIAACSVEFENVVVDGQPVTVGDSARAFYTRFPAFREQADSFIDDRGNFTNPS